MIYITQRPKNYVQFQQLLNGVMKLIVLMDRGLNPNMQKVSSMTEALLKYPEQTKIILTDDNKCVGWIFEQEIKIHPNYFNNINF